MSYNESSRCRAESILSGRIRGDANGNPHGFLTETTLGERHPVGDQRLSRAAAQRLSLYLRCLSAWPLDGGKVSSGRIAAAVGVSDAQVRRDLAALGHLGQRGIGYEARDLTTAIRAGLGIDRKWRTVLVGVGNLARALLKYQGFRRLKASRSPGFSTPTSQKSVKWWKVFPLSQSVCSPSGSALSKPSSVSLRCRAMSPKRGRCAGRIGRPRHSELRRSFCCIAAIGSHGDGGFDHPARATRLPHPTRRRQQPIGRR